MVDKRVLGFSLPNNTRGEISLLANTAPARKRSPAAKPVPEIDLQQELNIMLSAKEDVACETL
jgi:hypothetical protein